MEQQLAMNACQAGRCGELVDRGVLFCNRHGDMVGPELRRELLDAWRPGRAPTKRFLKALERARAEIRGVEVAGHSEPRDGHLPW